MLILNLKKTKLSLNPNTENPLLFSTKKIVPNLLFMEDGLTNG